MKNQADYSKYECPYSHVEKDCGHELNGPEGYENTHSVWCPCGFRGPAFSIDPEKLNLKPRSDMKPEEKENRMAYKTIEEIINGEYCPLPIEVIPNQMGINLCSVKGIEWSKQGDGQLFWLKIHFAPGPQGEPDEK
jgi:hypothetical protein